ncbi:hypothetical protein [Pedobacter endophyticus]|uniref:Carboxypeptidase-like regulatory domain-containing protein n=1 Tax=Pedobacter endophyticus TaxID=2789740 RepID=A0A7S9KYK3_9SPHI|nr:hypothetical protein [Pedobacter endophyticus]QPH39220.1 hypothetical protein IZT61_19550 [Pedobacter endophyticus]
MLKKKIIILDKADNKPIKGISILTESGGLIGDTNEKGEFIFDKSFFGELKITKIMIYSIDYQSVEFPIGILPNIIYVKKIKVNELDGVEIKAKRINKYYILSAFVRSWKLVNNKVVRYGDAITDYQILFEGSKYPFRAQKNKYIRAFRNFKIDSIKAKSKVFSITFSDGFFNDDLPNGDRISSSWSWYSTKKVKDSLYDVFDEGKNVGYAIFDKENFPVEINVTNDFDGDEALKIALWWKISGKSKNIEKWTKTDNIRHPIYIFSDKKTLEKSHNGKINEVETVTEIYLSDKIRFDWNKPIKYKANIDTDRSFYDKDYWTEEMKKHPLPSFILGQLGSINELENVY